MKKVILTLTTILITATVFAQSNQNPKIVKYVTTGPDGSIAMTILDDNRNKSIKLESANNFYKYEILDPKTSEEILVEKNKGKSCNIDKRKLQSGDYNLRLYTKSFVITTKLTIKASRKFTTALQGHAVAMND